MADLKISDLKLTSLNSKKLNLADAEELKLPVVKTSGTSLTSSSAAAVTTKSTDDNYTVVDLQDDHLQPVSFTSARPDIFTIAIKVIDTELIEKLKKGTEDDKDEIARKVDTDAVSKEQAEYLENYIKSAIDADGIKITENKKNGKTQTIKAENDNGDKVEVTVKYDAEGRITSINVVTTKTDGDTETKTTKGIDIEYDGEDMITKDKNPKPTAETEKKIKELMETLGCTRDEAIKTLKENDQYKTDDNATKIKEDGTQYKKNEDGEWEKVPYINIEKITGTLYDETVNRYNYL